MSKTLFEVLRGSEKRPIVLVDWTLSRDVPPNIRPVIIADRGFGNARWIGDVQKWGWSFVQRLSKQHHVEVEHHIRLLPELGIRKGYRPKSCG